jgi:hypothetical protein
MTTGTEITLTAPSVFKDSRATALQDASADLGSS